MLRNLPLLGGATARYPGRLGRKASGLGYATHSGGPQPRSSQVAAHGAAIGLCQSRPTSACPPPGAMLRAQLGRLEQLLGALRSLPAATTFARSVGGHP